MISIRRYYPQHVLLKSLVECYQWFSVSSPLQIMTVPNGRVDAWINLSGSFEFRDEKKNRYYAAPAMGFFPLSNSNTRVNIAEKLVCINIKFLPHILAFPVVAPLLKTTRTLGFEKVFDAAELDSFKSMLLRKPAKEQTLQALEDFLCRTVFRDSSSDAQLVTCLREMENSAAGSVKISAVAEKANMTVKTLERKFKKQLGITPKVFCKIVRFQKTIRQMQQQDRGERERQLIDALGNGYFDYSHFTKDSHDFTGLSPKNLLRSFLPETSDVIIEKRK